MSSPFFLAFWKKTKGKKNEVYGLAEDTKYRVNDIIVKDVYCVELKPALDWARSSQPAGGAMLPPSGGGGK